MSKRYIHKAAGLLAVRFGEDGDYHLFKDTQVIGQIPESLLTHGKDWAEEEGHQVAFTTEDGVVKYYGDSYFAASTLGVFPSVCNHLDRKHEGERCYHDRKNAAKWVRLNRQCLSLQDVIDSIGRYGETLVVNTLRKLVNDRTHGI